MSMTSFSPQEVAALSGASLAVVQKAISTQRVPAEVIGRTNRRRLDETALLAFALAEALPSELYLSPAAAYQLLRHAHSNHDLSELIIGDLVRIDAGLALASVRRRLSLYRRAQQLIVSDPDVMGGAPTIKGTRITAQSILGRIDDGDTVDTILDDYPHLDRETVEAAALYARANPLRGRPSGRLWVRAS